MTVSADKPWLALYPPHVDPEIDVRYPDMLTLWHDAADMAGHRPCVHYFDQTLTYADVDEASNALGASLVAGGLERGDRVGIYVQNDPAWLIALIACWKVGAIAVALNPMFKQRELSYHLNDSGAKVLVCLESLYREVVQRVLGETKIERVVTCHPTDWLGEDVPAVVASNIGERSPIEETDDLRDLVDHHRGEKPPAIELETDDVAILTYTSGTTGPPKGAMNTHGNMAYNSQLTAEWFELGGEDVVLGVAPLFHITGIVAHLGIALFAGVPVVLFHRFDVDETLRMVERWRATFVIAAITVFIALMDHPEIDDRDLSSLTKVASGGAPVSPSIVERFEEITGVYIHNVYGLTETTSPSHLTPLGAHPPVDEESGALSVGIPVPGADVRVVDLMTHEEVPVGTAGEIIIAGPMVVPGYWEKPEESAHAIPDGRLATGDVGFMNEDGWFFIVDRKKDQINAGGYKIWPREVEDVIYQHPAVREAAVVGAPDPYRGETVKAFVSLAVGKKVTPEDVIAFCRDRMAAYKYPRAVEILDGLPKTPTGKFLRRELRDREWEKARPAPSDRQGEASRGKAR